MSTLTLMSTGCCAGHPCDNCKTCQSGRCCRRDNPDYKLPELGEWDGPIYGELGVLNTNADKTECHFCGQWYRGVGRHAWLTHNLTPAEYKAIIGLPRTHGIVSPDQHDRLVLSLKDWREQHPITTSPSAHITPEQRSANAQRSTRLAIKASRMGHLANAVVNAAVKKRARTHCKHGHPLEGENLIIQSSSGARVCRTCMREVWRRFAEKKRTKARELYGDKARLNFPDEGL